MCFADHEDTPVPGYLINSCMIATDLDIINEVILLMSDFLDYDVG